MGETCDIVDEAVKRYKNSLLQTWKKIRKVLKKTKLLNGQLPNNVNESLNSLRVNLTEPCENLPYLHMNEECMYIHMSNKIKTRSPFNYVNHFSFLEDILKVGREDLSERDELQSTSVWGILRGLETFMHLLQYSDDGLEVQYIINQSKNAGNVFYEGFGAEHSY